VAYEDEPPPVPIDAAEVSATPADGGGIAAVKPDAQPSAGDAAVALPPVTIAVKTFAGSQYRVDGGAWRAVEGDTFNVEVHDHPVDVEIKNGCCVDKPLQVKRDDHSLTVPLEFAPAYVTPRCDAKGASAVVNGVPTRIGESKIITFDRDATQSTKSVTVNFSDGTKNDPHTVVVSAGKPLDVTCDLH
jgi:hypothetical protein